MRLLLQESSYPGNEFPFGDELASKGNAAVICDFQQNTVLITLGAGHVVGLGYIELQYAYLPFEFCVDDEENEQDGEDIEHGHNGYALQPEFSFIKLHGSESVVVFGEQVGEALVDAGCPPLQRALKEAGGYGAGYGYGQTKDGGVECLDRKSTRLNSSHSS